MYLSAVEIKNFRSFESLRVDLQSGLNVLVGRNNIGKTNLLQAIRHAIGPSGSPGEALWLDRDDFYRASALDTEARTIMIGLTFSGLSEAQRAYFYEIVDFNLTDLSKSTAKIRFQASWPKGKRQASIKRVGGPESAEPSEVPTKILQSLPITYLPALRDAEAYLTPGHRSRLASLLRYVASRKGEQTEEKIKEIYTTANQQLEAESLISETRASLQKTTRHISGTDYSPSAIKATEVEFDKILRTLQVQMDGAPIGSLSANGLGYNNLLYIAVVLQQLGPHDQDGQPVLVEPDEYPLLFVEEPEAHLHPQLVALLARYLANETPGADVPQTIVTTHSPTLAASVPPDRVQMLFKDPNGKVMCNSLKSAGMDDKEKGNFERMMDITRARLYFAKAVILVEGISEAVLVPILAARMGYDLSRLHISVIPICGVAFETFKKLFDPTALGIPVSIVTDADPPIIRGALWNNDIPESDGSKFKVSARTNKLLTVFSAHPTVRVCYSKLTLEFDLAEAALENVELMANVWEDCFAGIPRTFNQDLITNAGGSVQDKAFVCWRGICRAEHSGSKAEFAQRMAYKLSEKRVTGEWAFNFTVPEYLKDAINYVSKSCEQSGEGQEQ
ncbi:MAG: ATP-dependent nuclease [Terriglobales bacterium]